MNTLKNTGLASCTESIFTKMFPFFVLYYCTKNVIGGFKFEYSLSPTLSTTTAAPHHHVQCIAQDHCPNCPTHQRESNDQDGQLH